MPLTEASKSKVSLTSLSATTAAAAESLWSRSKKSSKRRSSKSIPDSTPEVSSNNPSTNPLIKTSPSTNQIPLQPQPLDRNEFRRKFLEGLQFYCENSSLILNSDLPADLIEFVTSHGFSVESLGIILELKKSSSAFSASVDRKALGEGSALGATASKDQQVHEQNFSETSRKLLQHWMSADSCAEAFVSLSLGEEIPGLIAECASFQRILFAVPDNFHLIGDDFLSFLLGQLLLSISTLVYGVKKASSSKSTDKNGNTGEKDVEPIKVRTQMLATFLDRVFMRYFSDVDHFHNSIADRHANNYFQDFVLELTTLCCDDVIAKRLVSKIFLHLGSHSAAKLTKVIFSLGKCKDRNLPSALLWPAFEFLESNSQWKFILQTLPVKTVTKSKSFWLRWAEYVGKETQYFTEYWHKSIEHWIVLNKSTLVDEHSLYSTSLAITALAKQVKVRINNEERKGQISQLILSLNPGEVLQNIVHSLESINEDKRACGMAVGQIVADMQFQLSTINDESQNGDTPKKLKFECKSEMFIDIINFFESEDIGSWDAPEQLIKASGFSDSRKIEVLDSDDDEVPEGNEQKKHLETDDGFTTLGEDNGNISEVAIDSRVLTLRARKRRIPMYFSEIVETLLEKSKEEDEAEILQFIVVLKIPVLLFMGVSIDSKMATTIARCLADLEDGTSLNVPILLGLYELFVLHPLEVTEVLSEVTFNGDHYALGQRLINLARLTHIVQLSSKQSCYNCFGHVLREHRKELLGIYPDFVEKYLHSRMKLRVCSDCRATGIVNIEMENEAGSSSNFDDNSKPLTWRQIVDRRVAAKTRYFVTPRSKTVVTVPDEYSSKLLPILWSSIANRLTSKSKFYVDKDERRKFGNMHDMFLVKIFQYLARCVLGASGPNCPHIRNVSSHAGELIPTFFPHDEAIVRRAVLSLLGVTLTVGEGKTFIIEALSSHGSILETVDQMMKVEEDIENRKFLGQIQQCLATYTTVELLKDLSLK